MVNQGRFASVHSLGEDRQIRIIFISSVTEDLPLTESVEQRGGREKTEMRHERFYDRSQAGAWEAADARYLSFMGSMIRLFDDLPRRRTKSVNT